MALSFLMRVQTFLLDLDAHALLVLLPCMLPCPSEILCALPRHKVGSLGIKCDPCKFRLAVVLMLRGHYDSSVQVMRSTWSCCLSCRSLRSNCSGC